MASLMDIIMQEYRTATPESRAANVARMNDSVAAMNATPVVQPMQPGMSPEELAYSLANPDPTRRSSEEAVGRMRAPSFQRLMQAGAMSQSINPARAAIGEQALAQARGNMAVRQGLGGIDEVEFQYRPSMAPQPTPPMPDEVGFQYRPSMSPALAPRMPDEVGFQYRPSMNPLANPALNQPVVAGLDTTNRPAPMASSVTAPARPQGFFEQLFKGPQYQSNNMLLQAEGQPINFGDPNSAADFFRADALLRQQNPSFFGLLGGNNG